jgi:Bacterial protein of unknown function (DUF899)
MSLPDVVSRDQWLEARRRLLAQEKEMTRSRDELNAGRRRLPMVQVDQDYVFEGPDGPAGRMTVTAVQAVPGTSRAGLLRYAGSVEQASEHAVAAAVTALATAEPVTLTSATRTPR